MQILEQSSVLMKKDSNILNNDTASIFRVETEAPSYNTLLEPPRTVYYTHIHTCKRVRAHMHTHYHENLDL
jgi:hypothetical protein